jgi:hypothetical protein
MTIVAGDDDVWRQEFYFLTAETGGNERCDALRFILPAQADVR